MICNKIIIVNRDFTLYKYNSLTLYTYVNQFMICYFTIFVSHA